MKERIIALLSAILIALSFTMPVHAAIAVTPDMVSIAYDLLGSMGVIAAMEGTHAQKYDSVEDWITSPNANVTSMLNELETWGNITTTDTGAREFHFDLDADLERVGELLSNLYTAVADYISSSLAPDIPSDAGTLDLSSLSSRTVIGSSSADGGFYFCQNSVMDYYRISDGVVTRIKYSVGSEPVSTVLCSLSGDNVFCLSVGSSSIDWGVYSSTGSSLSPSGRYRNVGSSSSPSAFGLAVDVGGTWSHWGTMNIPADNVGDNFNKEALIPADVWAGGFTDSLARGQDVVLRLPDSLAGYDDIATVYDPEAGLVAGVDIPGYVDAGTGVITGAGEGDLTHDFAGVVSGIGSLGSKLTDILSKIAALPALLAAALVGTGSLDFSGFQSIELYNKFPFCIPWDLKNCFVDFNVSPLEPKFVYDFSGTPLSAAGTVEIDLTKFDSLFQIVRYFVFAGFAVGLIVITRNLIRG